MTPSELKNELDDIRNALDAVLMSVEQSGPSPEIDRQLKELEPRIGRICESIPLLPPTDARSFATSLESAVSDLERLADMIKPATGTAQDTVAGNRARAARAYGRRPGGS